MDKEDFSNADEDFEIIIDALCDGTLDIPQSEKYLELCNETQYNDGLTIITVEKLVFYENT